MNKNPLIIYHANCHDGFGGAFAAWKKYGDGAEYFPARYGDIPPIIVGRDVIIIDFSYPAETLQKMQAKASSLIVLDHHIGAEADIKSIKNYVYDINYSGAVLAWSYLFPDKPTPKLFLYLEQGDLYKFDLPRTLDIKTYIYALPMDFQLYEKLLEEFEDEKKLETFANKGAVFSEYRQIILEHIARKAGDVEFEGYRVLAVNAPHEFRSDLGNYLATKKPPFGIVWYPEKNDFSFSLRGTGSVNLSEIAKKYGGGGHHNAASFRWDIKTSFPFKKLG